MTGAAKPQRQHWAAGSNCRQYFRNGRSTSTRRAAVTGPGILAPCTHWSSSSIVSGLLWAVLPCKACEGVKLISLAPQIEAHGAAGCQILFDLLDIVGPHAAPPGQG